MRGTHCKGCMGGGRTAGDGHGSIQRGPTGVPAPAVAEEVLSDYRATGVTLRAHPMQLLRNQPPFNRCKRHADLATVGNNRFIRIAGLVTCRQRPGIRRYSLSGLATGWPIGRRPGWWPCVYRSLLG